MGRAFLGEFEQRVLLAILRTGDQAFAIEVRKAVEDASGQPVSRGAFYTTLDRLERKGLLRWTAVRGGDDRDGLPQRRFRVTAPGAARAQGVPQDPARALGRPRMDAGRELARRPPQNGEQGRTPAAAGPGAPDARAAGRHARAQHHRRSHRGIPRARVAPAPRHVLVLAAGAAAGASDTAAIHADSGCEGER